MFAQPLRSSSPDLYHGKYVAGGFASGEQGVWYEPSLSDGTLFQDAAGAIPVTNVEQPVGLMLDKSKGLVLGSERVSNGGFGAGATGWSAIGSATLTVSAGIASVNVTGASGGIVSFNQSLRLTVGVGYQVSFDVDLSAMSAGGLEFRVAGIGVASITTSGSKKAFFVASVANPTISIQRALSATGTFTVDNISVREIPGNHAKQTTSADRPVFSARYNLLLATNTLSTQSVTTVATSYVLAFSGTGTVTLSGTATGAKSAGANTFTATAGTLTLTVSGSVTSASLVPANQAQLPYQRVNTATDYDADPVKFPPYLKFNGVNSWMVTPSINFTGTDKMTVFCGVRKLSDAAPAILLELSSDVNGSSGAFFVVAPSATSSRDYQYRSKAANPISGFGGIASSGVFLSPLTNVITGISSIPSDIVNLRVNGAQVGTATADQGTGNYGNYPLFIGRRGGTSLPFNGQIYSLIIRGAATDDAHLTHTEKYIAYKTGITL